MPEKGRKLSQEPKLFPRGSQGILYFRRNVAGRDKWISLGTSDHDAALKNLKKIVDSHTSIAALSKVEQSAHKLAEVFVEGVTGKKQQSIPLSEAHRKWISVTPGYEDTTIDTQNLYESIFRRFAEWAEAQGIKDCDQVTKEHALEYARFLWAGGIGGKTYNEHLKHLSRVFSAIDMMTPLQCRDPFDRRNVKRKRKTELGVISHEPLEPAQLEAVLKKAAENGTDWRDLFLLGANTGMRLKDACLLEWKSVGPSFIDITPCKTAKTGNAARIPISPTLGEILSARRRSPDKGIHVIPAIATHYSKNPDFVIKKAKSIFDDALGKNATRLLPDKHRMRSASIFSFHSFRTTFMSMLARQNVSSRDAMRILGWESPEMIRIYEKELERARGDADSRALSLINSMDELKFAIPAASEPQGPLRPDAEQLKTLVEEYSNVTIGKIYGVSEMAVRKWLDKYGVDRSRRIQSDITDESELAKIRETLNQKR